MALDRVHFFVLLAWAFVTRSVACAAARKAASALPSLVPRPTTGSLRIGRGLNHLLLLLAAAPAVVACGAPPPTPAIDARGLPRVPALGHPTVADAASDAAGDATPNDNALRIEHVPDALQVYRSTMVSLTAVLPPAHRGARCTWSFGGPPEPGACAIEHTFIGGTADERVTVTAADGDWQATATRIVPLERLPVSARKLEPETEAGLPTKPADGFRLVVIADTAGASSARLTAVAQRIVAIGADLVVHLGGHADDGEEQSRLRESLAEGLRAANIPLLPAVSPHDLAVDVEARRPIGRNGEPLELNDGSAGGTGGRFPEQWAFSYQGVFFAFTSGADQSAASLDWLRDRLTEAQIYESRLVFSYLPLHPFGERVPAGEGAHMLGPKFKVYELLLRARTTALFSAGHHVYFKGRYGALPVVSVGSVAAGGDRLLGHDVAQPASFVVVDCARGVPERVFALVSGEGAGDGAFDQILDEAYLPETVEVYTR